MLVLNVDLGLVYDFLDREDASAQLEKHTVYDAKRVRILTLVAFFLQRDLTSLLNRYSTPEIDELLVFFI